MTLNMNLNKKQKMIQMEKNIKYEQNYPGMLMVVDGSNLAHRAYHKFLKLTRKSDDRPVGLIYGFLRVLQSYLIRFRPSYLVVVFDTKQSKSTNFRKEILDTYKVHRNMEQNPYIDYVDFNNQQRDLRKFLKHLGVTVVIDKKGLGHEADDYIAHLVMLNKQRSSLIISSDKDFCQLIQKGVRLFNPAKEVIISVNNCKSVMDYEPQECVDYLSLTGDKSDDIPGYKGIGPVKARAFLDQYGSIENFLSNKKNKFPGIDYEALEYLWKRNKTLVDIRYGLELYPINTLPIRYSKLDETAARRMFSAFEMFSMMKKEFLEPFKLLKPWEA